MISEQFNIFDFVSNYKITKTIRLIELFAGIGAQSKALENLDADFESYKICEWSKESIKAYTYVHHYEEIKKCDEKEIINLDGISRDYNEPMTQKQINNLKEDEKILISNCVKISHNLIDISKVKGEDLNIVDTDKYEYILTYSFPCQDLSLAGKLKGMEENSKTRSSLLREVCRILKECKNKPQILLMENVPEVIGTRNKNSFLKYLHMLEDLGYSNFYDILNAKDFYIPQNRRRCFMVSILGKEHIFAFPKKIKLDYHLKDFLEKQVDGKYYLSKKMLNYILSVSKKFKNNNCNINLDVARTLTTAQNKRASITTYISEDLPSNFNLRNNALLIPEATKKGYAEAHDGDGVYLDRPHQKRGVVQKGMVQTLKTSGNDIGVVVPCDFRYDEELRGRSDKSVIPTLTTKQSGFSGTPLVKTNCRIRKLTPLECYKLMGFTKLDYEHCASMQSATSIYHQAGDSIVVTVLMAIFGKLLDLDYEAIIKNYVKNLLVQ